MRPIVFVLRAIALAAVMASPVSAVCAQQPDRLDSTHVDRTFFTRRDAIVGAAGVAGSLIVAIFDQRIANWWRSPGVQGDSSRYDAVHGMTFVNEVPLTIGAFAMYGVGRLTHANTLADIALHTGESLVLTVSASEAIRIVAGRARPRRSPNDPFLFDVGAGLTNFDFRAYPSIHAAVAFATASSVAGEVGLRWPRQGRYIGPALYAVATIPGFTRMYLDQHWASDVVSGTVLGALLGHKVVHYAHSHRRSKLDRMLLGSSVVPDGRGGLLVMVTIRD